MNPTERHTMTKLSPLALTLAALVIFLFTVALVTFADGVANVGACGVGPAAPSGVTCQELGR